MANLGVHGEYLKTDLKLTNRDEFSNPNREDTISVYTLDDVLRRDVLDRLRCEPRLRPYRVRSVNEDSPKTAIDKLTKQALASRSDKIMIMDARKATLTLLRPAYNHVVTLNRRDFTRYAHAVLIADGPSDLLKPGKRPSIFLTYLLDLKRDFCQSLYFFDPLIHYQPSETTYLSMDGDWEIADNLPERLKKELIGKRLIGDSDKVRGKHIRKHFRGLKEGELDPVARAKRMAELHDVYASRIRQTFPDDPDAVTWLDKEGYFLPGYGAMHVYPFFFETLIADLLEAIEKQKK